MRKDDFLKELEYLLQDIPDDEKKDAIAYYRDYLEEAGPEREEEVLAGFGSPEKIASEIRMNLTGNVNQRGEFTDQGYTDRRFDRTFHPAVSVPQGARTQGAAGKGEASHSDGGRTDHGKREDKRFRGIKEFFSGRAEDVWWKYLLAGVAVIVIAPVLFSILLGIMGSLVGVFSLLVGCLILLAVLTLTAFVGGAALLANGFLHLFTGFWSGVMMVGMGMIAIGCGFLLFFCSYMFYGRFLPWAFRGIWRVCRKAVASLPGQVR